LVGSLLPSLQGSKENPRPLLVAGQPECFSHTSSFGREVYLSIVAFLYFTYNSFLQ
jgi:hypothetical protein